MRRPLVIPTIGSPPAERYDPQNEAHFRSELSRLLGYLPVTLDQRYLRTSDGPFGGGLSTGIGGLVYADTDAGRHYRWSLGGDVATVWAASATYAEPLPGDAWDDLTAPGATVPVGLITELLVPWPPVGYRTIGRVEAWCPDPVNGGRMMCGAVLLDTPAAAAAATNLDVILWREAPAGVFEPVTDPEQATHQIQTDSPGVYSMQPVALVEQAALVQRRDGTYFITGA